MRHRRGIKKRNCVVDRVGFVWWRSAFIKRNKANRESQGLLRTLLPLPIYNPRRNTWAVIAFEIFLYAFTTRPAPICLLFLLSCQSIIKRVTSSRNFRFQRLILPHGRARRQTRKASNSLNNNKVRERLLMNRSPFAIWKRQKTAKWKTTILMP